MSEEKAWLNGYLVVRVLRIDTLRGKRTALVELTCEDFNGNLLATLVEDSLAVGGLGVGDTMKWGPVQMEATLRQ